MNPYFIIQYHTMHLTNYKVTIFLLSFFCGTSTQLGPRLKTVQISIPYACTRAHTHTHMHSRAHGKIPLNRRSPCCRGCYLHIRRDEHLCPQGDSTSKIQTHNPSTPTATDLCLRLQCHWDQLQYVFSNIFFFPVLYIANWYM